jgi:hypothetical protein
LVLSSIALSTLKTEGVKKRFMAGAPTQDSRDNSRVKYTLGDTQRQTDTLPQTDHVRLI